MDRGRSDRLLPFFPLLSFLVSAAAILIANGVMDLQTAV